jgi:hypothetical protein
VALERRNSRRRRRACRRTGRGSRLRCVRPKVVDSRGGRRRGLFVVALAKKKRMASRRGVHAAANGESEGDDRWLVNFLPDPLASFVYPDSRSDATEYCVTESRRY